MYVVRLNKLVISSTNMFITALFSLLCMGITHAQLTPDGCRFQTGKCRYEVKLSQEGTCKDSSTAEQMKDVEAKLKLLESDSTNHKVSVEALKIQLKELVAAVQYVQSKLGGVQNDKKDLLKWQQNSTGIQNKMDSRIQLLEGLVEDLRMKARNDSQCSSHVIEMQRKLDDGRTECSRQVKDIQLRLSQALSQLTEELSRKNTTLDKLTKCQGELAEKQDCLKNLTEVEAQLSKQLKFNASTLQVDKRYPKVAKSCSEWKSQGFTKTGTYIIDPDGFNYGVGPLEVTCDMNHGNGTRTTIHHRNEAPAEVTQCATPLCHEVNIQYGALLEQVAAVIDNSVSCKQYIKYECIGFNLFLIYGDSPYAAWYTRDGHLMKNWGGVPDGGSGCACGLTNSCLKYSLKCNCDANEQRWGEDSGFLTNKDNLPVTRLAFGDGRVDNNGNEAAWVTLGPVECED